MIPKRVAWLACAVVAFAGLSLAQTTAIQGKVLGDDGAPYKGAVIKIDRLDIIAHYHVKTDKRGEWYYGGLQLGDYNVCVEVDGKQRDCVNKLHTTTEKITVVDFNLKTKKEQDASLTAAIASGKLTKAQEKEVTPEQRAQIEEAVKKRAQAMAKSKSLNDAFNAGMEALNCGKRPAACPTSAPVDPANPQGATQPMTAGSYFQLAIDWFKKAGAVDPTQDAIWSHLAEAYVGLAATQNGAEQDATLNSAAETYEKSIALKPDDAAAHNNYALVLARLKKFPEASAELQKAAAIDPANGGKYYYNLGAMLVNKAQYNEAADVFKKAIELTPSYAEPHYQYAVCLSSKMTVTPDGKTVAPPEMKGELEKYLELAPNGPNAESAKAMLAALTTQVQTQYTNPNAAPAKKPKKK
jgi:tetratricopeptide (TPR) repeat protein